MTLPPLSSLVIGSLPTPAISEEEAVVLRVYPFSNTSHMVVWLTSSGRRLVTAVRGAMRPKSAFLGQYDMFYRCELLYYTRGGGGVHAVRDCCALDSHDRLRVNWRAEQCASWFAALADIVSNSDVALPGLYRLLSETLDVLCLYPAAPPAALFARFEAKLLYEAGLKPNFEGASKTGISSFRIADGRISGAPGADSDSVRRGPSPVLPVTPETIALCEAFAASRSVGPSSSLLRTPAPAVRPLLRLLGLFIRYHVPDAPQTGRATALGALAI